MLLTDNFQGFIRVFNVDSGEYVTHLEPKIRNEWLQLYHPKMAVLDQKDRLWVYEAGKRRIVVFRFI